MELKNNQFTREFGETDFQQQENKQLVFSIADEMPYMRHDDVFGDYYEVLEISEKAIDTTRLVKNMPFLKDHDHAAQLGAVKRFWIDENTKKLYVSVKFSKSKFAQSIKEDIIDLIRMNTSVGYFVNQFEKTGEIDGVPVLRAISWTPYQASSVSVPASVFVGYNRSIEIQQKGQVRMSNVETNKTDVAAEGVERKLETKETDSSREDQNTIVEDLETKSEETTKVEEEKEMCPECNKPLDECECEKACGDNKEKACGEMKPEEKGIANIEEITKDAVAEALQKQIEAEAIEIRSLGELTGEDQSAQQFIAQKRSLQEFKTYIQNKRSNKSKNSIQKDTKMNKYFSISKAIRNSCSQYKKDISEEYETQVIAENKRSFNVDDADIVLSNKELLSKGALYRSLTGSAISGPQLGPSGAIDGGELDGTVGQSLIATDYLPQEFVTFLRPQLTLDKTGYYSIPVNGNAVSFAVCTSGSVAGMYNLDGELSGSDLKFATKTLTPHKAGVLVPVNYSMILQARPEVDAMVEADIVNALYQIRDEQILIGTGTSGQCLGILNTPGIGGAYNSGTNLSGVALSGAWQALLGAENEIRKANVFSERLSFVMNGDTYVKLCATPKNKDNCMAGFICENDTIKNFPVFVNNKMPANTILLGDFTQVAVADFEGLKIKVDDITYIKQQAVQIVAIKAFDCVVRRPGAFCVVTLAAE